MVDARSAMAPQTTVIGVVTFALRPTNARKFLTAADPRETARWLVEIGSISHR